VDNSASVLAERPVIFIPVHSKFGISNALLMIYDGIDFAVRNRNGWLPDS
jgi:hypothetical protein